MSIPGVKILFAGEKGKGRDVYLGNKKTFIVGKKDHHDIKKWGNILPVAIGGERGVFG